MIDTFRTRFAAGGADMSIVDFAQQVLYSTRSRIRIGRSHTPCDATVLAYVNHGRWLGKCECGGAEYVEPDQPIFMCCSCWNAGDAHLWRPVVFPEEQRTIEALLLVRPAEARNWVPGEGLGDLAAENEAHGLPAMTIEQASLVGQPAQAPAARWVPGELGDIAMEKGEDT